MHSPFWLVLLAAIAPAVLPAKPLSATRSPGDLTGPWRLFVDDSIVSTKADVARRYHPFVKHAANPVLKADRPWEGNVTYLYGSVLPGENGAGYRMWYHAYDGKGYRNLYATSPDGLVWTKPNLGLEEFEGSKDNNLLFRRTPQDHIPQVIATPWEKDPQRHYRMLNYDYGRTWPHNFISGFWAAYSADGIHWKDAPRNPVLADVGDVGNFNWDPRQKKYVGYTKIFAPVNGFRRRAIGYTATRDFEKWNPAELILVPDELDDRWVTQDKQHTDFYGLSAFPYESGYVGFLWIFRIVDGWNDGPILVELVSSQDGINWHRQEGDRDPILDVGPAGAWDAGMIITPNHPLVEGDTIKLFYGAFGTTHGSKAHTGGIGLATLRKDGFASLEAGKSAGQVTTKALRHAAGKLWVNASLRAGGWLKAEVLDGAGKVIPGYGLDDCNAVMGDGIELPVSWRGKTSLPAKREALHLRFVFSNGSLYSFRAGDELRVSEEDRFPDIALTFDQGSDPRLILSGAAAIVANAGANSSGALVLRKAGDVADIADTSRLGREFTLAARVQANASRVSRIFSAHRGTGDPVTGELIFDICTATGVLRFFASGQKVQSVPRYCGDKKYHHYAVTYANGDVTLYLDGHQVGSGRILQGSAHLFNSEATVEHFGAPAVRSEVGINLGGNLRIGEDWSGRFITNKEEGSNVLTQQLVGAVDDILIARRVLTAAEIRTLAR